MIEFSNGSDGSPALASVGVSFLVLLGALLRTGFAHEPNVFQMTPQERAGYFVKVNAESEKRWRELLDALHIKLPTSLPPPAVDPRRPKNTFQKAGSSNWYDSTGNTYVRSPWGTWNNYDEAKGNPYPNLPDPLVLANGRQLKDPEIWWSERRPQTVAGFDEEIYGEEPANTPGVRWEVISSIDSMIGNIPVVTKMLVGHVDNSTYPKINVGIQLALTTPAKATRPVPVIMEFGFVLPPGFQFHGLPEPEGPTWREQVIGNGWACAVYVPTSVQPDNAAGLTEGIIGLVNKGQPRAPYDWGALRAWAWGASRAMDYFEGDKSVDATKVGIEGVSRYGKAVLVTMAYDQRFAIVCVGSSGKGGATLFRRDFGESMGNLCSSGEYHWFAGNFLKHVLTPNDLPVDSHELIALCAPRPVFISCGSPEVEGQWVDDRGQFVAEAAAGPVYALLGKKGLGTSTMPPIGTLLDGGALAFRQHNDGHTVGPNWPYFLRFAQEHFDSQGGSRGR